MNLSASFSSLSKTRPPPLSLSPSVSSRRLSFHPNAAQLLRFPRIPGSLQCGIFLRKPPPFSRQNNIAVTAALVSNQTENDGFVLEDVPHLTNFLPDLPVLLCLSPKLLLFLHSLFRNCLYNDRDIL